MHPVLTVRGLTTVFGPPSAPLKALDGVDLTVHAGEFVALVGESGSGKSLTGFSINGLLPAAARVTEGEIKLGDIDLRAQSPSQMRALRGRKVAMIFQDPMMTLNPVLRVGDQMARAVRAHDPVSQKAALDHARRALETVGIPSAAERLMAYPHQLSGGMRQRVAIAIALLHQPAVLIADEPTTALDVSIQGQILAEVRRLADDTGTAIVWITHDLAVVSSLADDICVMYAGRIVERGPAGDVIATPRHPYTRGLLDSVPAGHPPGQPLPQIPGSTPSLINLPAGCPFRTRCAHATEVCATPPPISGTTHTAHCHHPLRP
jgi:peptide/nickel transport system ATP-binding protein